jgi:hypothetical protein
LLQNYIQKVSGSDFSGLLNVLTKLQSLFVSVRNEGYEYVRLLDPNFQSGEFVGDFNLLAT